MQGDDEERDPPWIAELREREVRPARPGAAHASAYYPAQTPPLVTPHRTLEVAPVRLAPEIEPRFAATVPRIRDAELERQGERFRDMAKSAPSQVVLRGALGGTIVAGAVAAYLLWPPSVDPHQTPSTLAHSAGAASPGAATSAPSLGPMKATAHPVAAASEAPFAPVAPATATSGNTEASPPAVVRPAATGSTRPAATEPTVSGEGAAGRARHAPASASVRAVGQRPQSQRSWIAPESEGAWLK